MKETDLRLDGKSHQDDLFRQAAGTYGAALYRLARAYESDPEMRRDLLQEIHLALWRSFEGFEARCSLRTWVYRVAHNTATSHIIRQRRTNAQNFVSLDEVETLPDKKEGVLAAEAVERLLKLVHRLKPLDRQVILSYLEGMDASSIGEITGISPGNVATKIHRIKNILARQFQKGGRDD